MGKVKKEIIGIIGTTPGVDELVSQLEAIDKTAGDEIEALRVRAMAIADASTKTKDPLWSALAKQCGRPDDFRDREELGYDVTTKAVYAKPIRHARDSLGGIISSVIDGLRCKDPECQVCNPKEGES